MSKGREGKEGRLGDATRARIDDLKGGWKLPGAPAEEQDERATMVSGETGGRSRDVAGGDERDNPVPSMRSKGPTKPPPGARGPGPSKAPPVGRSTGPSKPPPDTRAKGPTRPPPVPAAPSRVAASSSSALPSLPKSKPVTPAVAQARSSGPSSPPPLGSPLPTGAAKIQATPVRKPTPSPSPAMPAAPVVSLEGADDDDPTYLNTFDAPDAVVSRTALAANGHATGSVRLPDSLPRSGGVLGDIAYLFRVLAKKRSTRRELARNKERIASEKEARNHKLLEVARHAIGDDRLDQSLVDRARSSLLEIEEKRSLHAGRVAAADEKVAVLERHLTEAQIKRRAERERLRLEIEAIDTSLQPLVKRTAEARKLVARLRRQIQSLDEKMRLKRSSLVSVDGPANAAAVQAELASLQAERDTVAADEPGIAAEVDDLEPKIASLKSTRGELVRALDILDREKELDEVRVAEKVVAVKATRVVEDRAVSDQSVRRQDKLLELGEALHNEPPDAVTPRLKAIVKHDLELGTLERRELELRELMDSIERAPMLRGALYLLLILGSVAAALLFAISR